MKQLLLCVAIALIFIAIANTKTFKTAHTNGQGKAKTTQVVQSIKQSKYARVAQFVKSKEKFVPHVYVCPAGKRTIGYGHVLKRGERLTRITKRQADSLFLVDFQKHYDNVLRCGVRNRDTALVLASFSFNCGEQAVRKVAKNVSKIRKYIYVNNRICKGLVIRRNQELNLLNG